MASPDDDKRILAVPLVEHGGDRFPKDIALELSADRYVGFYENQHGEQLVFVRERGQKPQLFHGDYGRSPLEAVWPEISTAIPLAHWVSGQLILDQAEVLWLAACLQASRWLGDEAVRYYAEGAILVSLGINTKQRKPREGVTKEIWQRIEGEAAEVVRRVGS